ncbi:MAG: tetratricopeptide repeat protein [Cyanobacteria bacterium J06560_2]
MTADFAAEILVSPVPQTVETAKHFLSKGVELAKLQAFERAIAQFSQAIRLSLAILQQVPKLSPTQMSERALSTSEVTAVEVTATQSFYHRGCALCRLEEYERAIADFTHLIHQPPTSSAIPAEWLITKLTEIYIHRGNAYRRLGEHTQALADLDQSVTRSGGSAQSYGCRGLVHLDTGDFAGAIADFTQALALHPTFSQGYLWRGFARLRSNRPALAITDLDRAIAAIPNCAEAFNHRGLAYFYLNYLEQAQADFSRAIQINRDFAEAYNNRGNIFQLLGDSAAANVDYDQAITLDAQLAELYFNRAAGCKGTEQASADYKATADLPVDNAAFYRHRAEVKASEGHLRAAIDDYTTAIELVPTATALYRRGKLYVQIGEAAKAEEDFEGAIAQSPDYGIVYCARSQLRFQSQDFIGALADIDKAIAQLNPPRKELFVTRCLAHFALREPQQALEDFEQLITCIQSSSQTSNESTSIGSVGT